MKFIIFSIFVVFLALYVSVTESSESHALRIMKNMNIIANSLKTFQMPGKSSAAYSGQGEDAPLIRGINMAVDAIGQIILSILKILGLIENTDDQSHYCYGSQYNGN